MKCKNYNSFNYEAVKVIMVFLLSTNRQEQNQATTIPSF